MQNSSDSKKVDSYIDSFPQNIQELLQTMRQTIRECAPQATETISYGIPTFKLNGNLVHFASFTKHIGFYPGSEAIAVFAKKLEPYATSKGAVQFPLDRPLPLDLIKEITLYRVKENQKKSMK